ncbi:hypothetical protein ACX8XN_11415 [Calditrichota bacterium GD2]
MAEQFHKIYISASDFIKAWEKEVYELTNLDYFIYLLMNSLAGQIETSFFPALYNADEEFVLNSDEITNLAFHLGDSVQLFFDKNCFGGCPLDCPNQLQQKISQEDLVKAGKVPESAEFGIYSCTIKEHCLKYDLLNYVVIDAVLDFYRYDLKTSATDGHPVLQKLIQFINEKIVDLIKKEGDPLLKAPDENASDLFDRLIEFDDNSWTELDFSSLDDPDDFEMDEPWKRAENDLVTVLEEFETLTSTSGENHVINLFKKFVINFIGPLNINDLVYEDFEEFFLIVFPTEFAPEERIQFDGEIERFERFIKFVDYNYEKNFYDYWNELKTASLLELRRTFKLSQNFHQTHSYVEYQLSPEKEDPAILDGFFEVVDYEDGFFVVEDIHLKERYQDVDLSLLDGRFIEAGDIINMQIIPQNKGQWRAVWVECVFAPRSKYYLV